MSAGRCTVTVSKYLTLSAQKLEMRFAHASDAAVVRPKLKANHY